MANNNDITLRKRLVVIDIIIPITLLFGFLGGWYFFAFVTAVLLISGWELWRIFKIGGYGPSLAVILIAIASLTVARQLWGLAYNDLILAAIVLVAMAVHLAEQQRDASTSAVDFMITVGVALYLGWLGSYAISMRNLPGGLYWVLLVFPAVSLADAGGYIFGRLFGRHKIADKVSPNKTWAGYFGGIVLSIIGSIGIAALFHVIVPSIVILDGLIIGLVISILTPLGDFGESMLKRQFGVKDTSNILPGHGGILDRIDSSLWAAAIGYALILLLK